MKTMTTSTTASTTAFARTACTLPGIAADVRGLVAHASTDPTPAGELRPRAPRRGSSSIFYARNGFRSRSRPV